MDFSGSFGLQVFPFTGAGGFYFGVLDSTTSDRVPQASCGAFKPVFVFGLGLRVGLGRSFNKGILAAEISITVFGIIEGVIASWHAYPSPGGAPMLPSQALALSGGQDVSNQYYYWLQGTLGIIGKISGSVDFSIIKAEVNIVVTAYIRGTFEAYRASLIYLEAGVSISLKVRINLGFIKVTINLSFSAKVSQQFVIGRDHVQDAPWACGAPARLLRGASVHPGLTRRGDGAVRAPAGLRALRGAAATAHSSHHLLNAAPDHHRRGSERAAGSEGRLLDDALRGEPSQSDWSRPWRHAL
jgi:hypothetical protein